MEDTFSNLIGLIKRNIIYIILGVEMFFLFKTLGEFSQKQKYFSLSSEFAIPYACISVLSLWTISLISQTVNRKWKVILPPLIMFITSLIFFNSDTEIVIGSAIASLYFLYKFQVSKDLSDSLIKAKLTFSGKSAVKGFLFAISFITAFSIYLSSGDSYSFDVGEWVSNIMEQPIKEAVQKEYEKQTPEEITSLNLDSVKESNPQVAAVLNSFGITELPTNINLPTDNQESIIGMIKSSISSQINKAVEPYKRFFGSALAMLVFGLLQIYNYIVYFVYSNTIGIIVFILKKIKILKLEKITTEKEVFRF